jgi:hypothetical protein
MKRMLLILLFAAAGLVAACGPGSTSSPSPAIDAPAPTVVPSEELSMAPDASASTSP